MEIGCGWFRGQLQDSAAYIWFPWLPENYLGGLRGRCSGSGDGASSLENRWGLLPASPSVSTEAEDMGEGQGWLSRRQCGQLRGRPGTGAGSVGIMPFGFTACLPPRPLLSQEAGEGQRG